MEPLTATKMKATTTVTLFIITFLIAVGCSTVEVNAAEAAGQSSQPTAELDETAAEKQQRERERAERVAALRRNRMDRKEYECQQLLGKYAAQQQRELQIQNAEYAERQRRQQQCCVLLSRNSQTQSKMGDIWITVGLSTVFLFLMVLTLRVFRNLEGQRKSCRKTHPVPIDDLGGVTNLLG